MTNNRIELTFLVIDDHEAILAGTVPALQEQYACARIFKARDRYSAERIIERDSPDLVMVDLSLPEKPSAPANPDVGLGLVKDLLASALAPNIMVLSTDVTPLVRLKPTIATYEGGFAAMDKSLPVRDMLHFVEVTLRGSVYLPPQIRSRPEFERRWLELLQLKFKEGLTDKAIAKRMGVSERTIRNYWIRIQDAFSIYDDPEKDLRVQIEIEARKMGLIS
ncbi:MAG: response regulator transcription factor [Cyanobacteriota bacterium]|nr:response regulator transcription factor [Cyanobacteriota bacterium]